MYGVWGTGAAGRGRRREEAGGAGEPCGDRWRGGGPWRLCCRWWATARRPCHRGRLCAYPDAAGGTRVAGGTGLGLSLQVGACALAAVCAAERLVQGRAERGRAVPLA